MDKHITPVILMKHWWLEWSEPFYVPADDYVSFLSERYPQLDGDICVEGENFHRVSNRLHFQASGHSDLIHQLSLRELDAPAHFNPPFFVRIGTA